MKSRSSVIADSGMISARNERLSEMERRFFMLAKRYRLYSFSCECSMIGSFEGAVFLVKWSRIHSDFPY